MRPAYLYSPFMRRADSFMRKVGMFLEKPLINGINFTHRLIALQAVVNTGQNCVMFFFMVILCLSGMVFFVFCLIVYLFIYFSYCTESQLFPFDSSGRLPNPDQTEVATLVFFCFHIFSRLYEFEVTPKNEKQII